MSNLHRIPRSRAAKIIASLLLAAHLAITAWGVRNHEPWRDEAQKWLVARDAASITELWSLLPYEGTPALWLLLLRPFARAGAPYAVMNWLNWGIVGAAAALLLFRAPLPWPLKAATLLSYGMLCQFPVFASNYSLSLLLLFVALSVYPERRERPLRFAAAVALLANTSVIGALVALPLAVLVAVETARERPGAGRRWLGPTLMAAGFLVLIAQLVPAHLGTGSSIENELANPFITSTKSLLSIAALAFFPFVSGPEPPAAWGAAGLIFLLLVAASLWRRPRALGLLAGASALIMGVLVRVPSSHYRHTVFLVLMVVASFWMAAVERRETGGDEMGRRGAGSPIESAAVWLAVPLVALTGLKALELLRSDALLQFSRARETAEFIRSRGYSRTPIVAFPAGVCSSVLPYLPETRFFYSGLGEYGTFVKQGTRLWVGEKDLSSIRVLRRSLCRFPPGESFLVLLGSEAGAGWPPYCRQVFAPSWAPQVSLEQFWIFECNARSPDGALFPRELCTVDVLRPPP